MDRTGIAEWMLSRRFGAERASEIAGDMLEQHTPARARLEMLRLALAIRLPELAALFLLSVLFLIIQRALFSPWELHFMRALRDQHIGWPWDMFSLLAGMGLCGWFVAASSALRVGFASKFTRSALTLAITFSIVSVFMLQDGQRHIAPIVIGLVVLWTLRSYGFAATLGPILAATALIGSAILLMPITPLPELRDCVVEMHAHRLQPFWFSFTGGCTSLTLHEWARFALSLLLAFWLMAFLPGSSPRRRRTV